LHGANVVAVDVIGSLIKAARRRKEILEELLGRSLQCEFRHASVMDLDETDSYDVIWMEQAFQHLEPREAVVKKTVSLTKLGGHIIISEVNALNPLMQIQLFIARGMKMHFTYVDENGRETVMGNERIVTARWLKRLFESHNVHCENIRYFRIFPNHPVFNNLSRVEKLLARRWLAPLQTHFNYVGQRKR
jgi:2-polyprenyl-3-methyl-5-hydroxy-6-metoxy-1,4-benzoquinol methylase